MLLIISVLTMLAGGQPAAAPAAPPSVAEIRTRLDAYEKHAQQTGSADPAALAPIARLAVTRALRSARFVDWTEACASNVVDAAADCRTRLWDVLNGTKESVARRAEAAAALMQLRDAKAADALVAVIKNLDTARLTPLAPIIGLMPESRALPFLLRLIESSSEASQVAACRALGRFDTPEVRAVLVKTVQAAPPGATVWATCMTARAKLKERDAVMSLWGYGRDLDGEAMLDVATVMIDAGDPRGMDFLRDLARRGTGRARLGAAERLVDDERELAIRSAELLVKDADPELRAAALVVERRLKRPPSATVRRMLADPDPVVGLRAAEVVLDWVSRVGTP